MDFWSIKGDFWSNGGDLVLGLIGVNVGSSVII